MDYWQVESSRVPVPVGSKGLAVMVFTWTWTPGAILNYGGHGTKLDESLDQEQDTTDGGIETRKRTTRERARSDRKAPFAGDQDSSRLGSPRRREKNR